MSTSGDEGGGNEAAYFSTENTLTEEELIMFPTIIADAKQSNRDAIPFTLNLVPVHTAPLQPLSRVFMKKYVSASNIQPRRSSLGDLVEPHDFSVPEADLIAAVQSSMHPNDLSTEDVYLILRLLYADGKKKEADAMRKLYPNLPPPPINSFRPRASTTAISRHIHSQPSSSAPSNNVTITEVNSRVLSSRHGRNSRPRRSYTAIPIHTTQALNCPINPSISIQDLLLGYCPVEKDHVIVDSGTDPFHELGESGYYIYTNPETADLVGRMQYASHEILLCYVRPEFQ